MNISHFTRKEGNNQIKYQVIQGPGTILDFRNDPDEEFFPASGPFTRGIFKGTVLDANQRAKNKAVRQARKNKRVDVKATYANANLQAAKGLSMPDPKPSAVKGLAGAKKPSDGSVKKPAGMSTGMKVGIGVGVALILGAITFFVIKSSKHKK